MAATEKEKATKLAHELVAYIESEQSDLKASDNEFDALWQSIYDVCMLVHFNILDELLSEDWNYERIKNNEKLFNCYRYNKCDERGSSERIWN